MSESHNRRTFLATAGITVASVVTRHMFAQPKNSPPTPPPNIGTRESVAGMSADHPTLVSYRTAVEVMKGLPVTNPLSWQFHANMHGAKDEDGDNKWWRWCMHGNWWFLPWHRGYIYFFEKIVRMMSGNGAFRLPYWPWEKDGQSVLPAPFRDAMYQGNDNPLFDNTRVAAANDGDPLRPNPQEGSSGSFTIDWESARAISQFTSSFAELAYGGIRKPKSSKPVTTRQHGGMESKAHDLIHDAVGGDAGNMGDPETAARDPIFWLHHANVDRLWNRWLDIRGHDLPNETSDRDWYDQAFPFYDEKGNQVTVTVSKILELASKEARYDDDRMILAADARLATREKALEPTVVNVGAIQPKLELSTKPLIKTLVLAEDTKPRLMTALAAPRAGSEGPVILLRIEGIKPPKDVSLRFDVFLMKKGEKPSKNSYVGPISFFGRRGGHGHEDEEGFTQGFDVTERIHKLRTANRGTLPELDVSVVPHSTKGLSDEELVKKNISIPISNITLKLVTVNKK
jgi:tyrosinase